MAFLKTLWADRQVPKISAAQLNRIEQALDDLHNPVWHNIGAAGEPAFQNGWVNYDARVARFRVEGRRCFLSGVIKSGVIGQAAFTLPPWLQPDVAGNTDIPVESNAVFGTVTVHWNGTVIPAQGSNIYVFLDSVNFGVNFI